MPVFSWAIAAEQPKRYAVYKKVTTLGSAPDNDLVLEAPGVVPYHAVVMFDGRDFVLRETETSRQAVISQNGRKRRQFRLGHGDRVGIGEVGLTYSAYDEYAGGPARETGGDDTLLEGLTRLHDFSKLLMSQDDPAVLLQSLLDSVIAFTRADRGFLILLEGGEPVVLKSRNLPADEAPGAGDPARLLSDSILRRVIERREPLLVADALHDPAFSTAQSVMELKLCSVMCVPLFEGGNLLGVIYLGSDSIRNLFAEHHLRLLMVFASQAALLLEKGHLLERLRQDRDAQRPHASKKAELIGESDAIRDLLKRVAKVAPTDVAVLITGETGTGKELVALKVHELSKRHAGPFVAINCAAIPDTLMESELFGHVRGAFTGAVATQQGKFQFANHGTIFLDEIGELPLGLQVKLLRVLQDKVVVKVGDTRSERIDVRVLAATNKHLEGEVRAGRFREDLYYRLNVVTIEIRPLRQRGPDIKLLAEKFIERYAAEFNSPVRGLSPEALGVMRQFEWPGNVRQLENVIRKALVMCDGMLIGPKDLDLVESPGQLQPLEQAAESFKRDYVRKILDRNGGNRTQTAKDLGVDPRTIFRYLEKEEAEERSGQA